MKRFYTVVDVSEAMDLPNGISKQGWQVTLDGRGLKTVKGASQVVPTPALAEALAGEWDAQGETIEPASFPMRDMADYAIDVVARDTARTADALVAYADTDTLLYRADPDELLYAQQNALWEPIVSAFEAREGVLFERVSGIIHRPQPPAALATIRARLARFDPFTLAALEAKASLAASLITGLSALEAQADVAALWHAASLEEEWQAEKWGRDEEAEERRTRRTADFHRAAQFAALAKA